MNFDVASLQILVPFASSPSPEVTWKKGGKVVSESDKRAKIESNDYLTQLSYDKCERGDSATYTVKVIQFLFHVEQNVALNSHFFYPEVKLCTSVLKWFRWRARVRRHPKSKVISFGLGDLKNYYGVM